MRKTITAIALMLGLAITALAAAPAQADSPNQVTFSEYLQSDVGWSKGRIHDLYDVSGVQVDSWALGQLRKYNGAQDAVVYVTYLNGLDGVVRATKLCWRDPTDVDFCKQ